MIETSRINAGPKQPLILDQLFCNSLCSKCCGLNILFLLDGPYLI